MLVNPTNTNAETNMKDLQSAALGVRQRIQVLSAGSDLDLETAFATLAQSRPGALFVSPDTFLQDHRDQLLTWAAHHRVPTIYYERVFVDAGGLISYGPDQYDGFRGLASAPGEFSRARSPPTCRSCSRPNSSW